MRFGAIIAALVLSAAPVLAEAPEIALRPVLRAEPVALIRPMLRPEAAVVAAVVASPQQVRADALVVAEGRLSTRSVPLVVWSIPRQIARAEALLAPMLPPPLVLVGQWAAERPSPRPEGDFAGGEQLILAALRPAVRSEAVVGPEAVVIPAVLAVIAPLRPQLRPAVVAAPVPEVVDEVAPVEVALVAPAPQFSALAIATAIRPETRPPEVLQRASTQRVARVRGSVCGNPEIQGDVLEPIGGSGGCGVAEPVQIRSVGGVALSTAAIMDCTTAEALLDWVQRGAIPAVGNEGGGIASLRVAGHYTCRPRNNQAGARLSEHGMGRAIDIAAIGLRNGGEISVLTGWDRAGDGQRLRAMHQAACGTFGTVLGPDANRMHADHFHFDTARYRSGSYCR